MFDDVRNREAPSTGYTMYSLLLSPSNIAYMSATAREEPRITIMEDDRDQDKMARFWGGGCASSGECVYFISRCSKSGNPSLILRSLVQDRCGHDQRWITLSKITFCNLENLLNKKSSGCKTLKLFNARIFTREAFYEG